MSRAHKREIGAAVGEEAALAARLDERDQPAGLAARVAGEMRRRRRRARSRAGLAATVGGADAGDEIDRGAEMGEPDRLIRRRAAGPLDDRRAPVRAARERALGLARSCRSSRRRRRERAARRPPVRPLGHRRVSSTATCAATIALFSTSAMLASRLRPLGQFDDAAEQEGRHFLLGDSLGLRFGDRLGDARSRSPGRRAPCPRGSDWRSAGRRGRSRAAAAPCGRGRAAPSQRWSSLTPLERA